jgi:hypothetical protein
VVLYQVSTLSILLVVMVGVVPALLAAAVLHQASAPTLLQPAVHMTL